MHPVLHHRMLLLLLLLLGGSTATTTYCRFSGCAQPGDCQCVAYVSECDAPPSDPAGTCRFTALGIVLTLIGSLIALALLSALFSVVKCFRKLLCCCCGCCKRDATHHHHYHAGSDGADAQAMHGDL